MSDEVTRLRAECAVLRAERNEVLDAAEAFIAATEMAEVSTALGFHLPKQLFVSRLILRAVIAKARGGA